MINEEHNVVIKKTLKIRELEHKIKEIENKKVKNGELLSHNEADINVIFFFK